MLNVRALIIICSYNCGCRNTQGSKLVKNTSCVRGQYKNNTWSGVHNILDPYTTVSWPPQYMFYIIPIIQIFSIKNGLVHVLKFLPICLISPLNKRIFCKYK